MTDGLSDSVTHVGSIASHDANYNVLKNARVVKKVPGQFARKQKCKFFSGGLAFCFKIYILRRHSCMALDAEMQRGWTGGLTDVGSG